MSFEDIAARKAALRKSIRAMRRELSDEQRAYAASAVRDRLLELFMQKRLLPCRVMVYMPMRYELDILPAAEALAELGAEPVFPLCIEDGGLRLFIPHGRESFAPRAYGILEPIPEASTEITPQELGAVILPAIGFDGERNRLGQGGGYYDRLLARTSCFTVAVGFDCQLVSLVPTEPTDRPVDAVVTPGRTIAG